MVSLTLDRDATLAVGVAGRSADLPASARRFFDSLSKPSDLWRQIPDDALLAIGGRFDFVALSEVIGEFMTPASRQQLHTQARKVFTALAKKDLVKDVLAHVGPEWALVVIAPSDTGHLLPVALFALRGAGDRAAMLDGMLLDQLNKFSVLAEVFHAQNFPEKPLLPKKGTFGKQDVNYLESEVFPPGVRPAFALKDGFLLLASAPEQIGRFAAPKPGNPEGPAPLLRVSFKAWRDYLQSHRDGLAKFLVDKDPRVNPDEAREHIDTVLSVLEFVDRLEIRQQAGKGYAVVSFVIQTAQPLRK